MSDIAPDRLASLAIEALERTALVLAVYCDDPEQAPSFTPTRCSKLSFSGVADGSVYLEADDGFLRELAAGMLGCDPDEVDPAAQGADALKELTNIVGGSLVVAFGGVDQDYVYGLPEIVDPSQRVAPDANDSASGVETMVAGDEGVLRVTWCREAASERQAA